MTKFRTGIMPIFLLAGALTAGGMAQAQDRPLKNLAACKSGAFSTEEDFMMTQSKPFDGNPYVSDGDLLSPDGQVCARNAELVQRFDVQEDLGLDGVDIISMEPGLVAFSTELDSPFGQFTSGDIVFTGGGVIPNAALMAPFGVRLGIGLDELKFIGRTENILKLVEFARRDGNDKWTNGRLQALLKELRLDIWFSVEGTIIRRDRQILDGDILSALGNVVATNQQLLAPGAPAGIPADGVDFGIDAFAMAREKIGDAKDFSDLFISTEILHNGKRSFTDGDVLEQGGAIVATNEDMMKPFYPTAAFLGLDALWFPFGVVNGDPSITTMCDLSVGEFNGGIVPVGGNGTGLHESPLSPPALTDTLTRPCGLYVPIDGALPVPANTVNRFRVVYREQAEPVPGVVGDAATPAIQTSWSLTKGKWKFVPFVGFKWVCEKPSVLSTDANGWMDAQDFVDAKNGIGSYIGCPHELRLAVWNTIALPAGTADGFPIPALRDREDHYAVWLEWEDSSAVMQREPVEHHVQLDNTLPIISPYPDGLQLRLTDGVTVVPACGEAPIATSDFQVWAQFSDRYYSQFSLGLKGGMPPAVVGYGPHLFFDPTDGTALVKNTDDTGTLPDTSTVHLRDISLADLGASAVKCCYFLDMYVYDRSIRNTFDGTFVNSFTGGNYSYAFMTFAGSPA